MLFGKRARDKKTPAEREPPSSESRDEDGAQDTIAISADRAVDLLGEILRLYGEQAFDVPPRKAKELESFFEDWARHLLVGTPPPAHPDADPSEADATASAAGSHDDNGAARARDLPGLRQAFRKLREKEQHYVNDTLGHFREASWSFISGLRRSLNADQATDRRIGHRMRRLESAVQSGDAGNIKTEAQEMLTNLTEFLAERGENHKAQITEMASRLEGLRHELDSVRAQAAIDPVTGIYNRASFDEQIEREVDLATLFGRRGCLLMVDIDHFKWVNDTHGHQTGDRVLAEVASTLARCFMRKDDFLARYGGEEFCIVLRDVDAQLAEKVAERGMMAMRNMEVEIAGSDEPLRLTVSMGLARLRPGETAPSWIERADRALYQAKDGGRDRIVADAVDVQTETDARSDE